MLAAVRARYARWRGYHGLGMGDVKLLAASTVWVGPLGVSWLILAACLSALATIAVMRLRGRTIGATTRLPFGPHIAVGLVVVLAGGSTT
jgi:prepilin signal peptidase PulO-like enzyme (type II secretory pathway)